MNRRRRLAAVGAVVGAASVAAATALLLSPTASAQGETLWTNPDTQAALWVEENAGDSRAALIDERIAQTPAGTWFTQHNPGEIQSEVASVVSAAASEGAAPIMVVYNIPDRDCGGASGGGAPSHSAYRDWIDQFAAGLSGPAYIVVEPDTLPHNCADPSERDQSLTHAVQALKAASPEAHVYLDIGHSNWLAPDTAASRLQNAGLQYADGFALNTSNYRTTEESTAYAHEIQNIVGSDKGAVIDTSRNGNGPLGDEWCDPSGRAIGDYPTTGTGVNGIDAYLWVKLPGEADGCAGGAGQFIPDLAYDMAEAAGSDWPGDLPTDPGTTDDETDEPTDDPTGDPQAACSAEIIVVNDWGSGWQAEVHVTAGGTAINGWNLTWDWPAGQSISSSWNADLSQSGSTVTAADVGWNGAVSSNETRNAFGFVGSGQSAVPAVECTP